MKIDEEKKYSTMDGRYFALFLICDIITLSVLFPLMSNFVGLIIWILFFLLFTFGLFTSFAHVIVNDEGIKSSSFWLNRGLLKPIILWSDISAITKTSYELQRGGRRYRVEVTVKDKAKYRKSGRRTGYGNTALSFPTSKNSFLADQLKAEWQKRIQ